MYGQLFPTAFPARRTHNANNPVGENPGRVIGGGNEGKEGNFIPFYDILKQLVCHFRMHAKQDQGTASKRSSFHTTGALFAIFNAFKARNRARQDRASGESFIRNLIRMPII